MSTTRERLETALQQSPADAALHAAYADLLLEEGDDRGEFILQQLRLEQSPKDAAEIDAVTQLWEQGHQRWAGPLTSDAYLATWTRGWITHLQIITYHAGLFELLATERICLLLREVHVEYGEQGNALVDELIAAELLLKRPVEKLTLRSCQLTDDGARALAAYPPIARLHDLNLDANYLSNLGMMALRDLGFHNLGGSYFLSDRRWRNHGI
ncbi:MAG: hypothetical protein ACRCZF_16005 [Gemmataceae bacterium]